MEIQFSGFVTEEDVTRLTRPLIRLRGNPESRALLPMRMVGVLFLLTGGPLLVAAILRCPGVTPWFLPVGLVSCAVGGVCLMAKALGVTRGLRVEIRGVASDLGIRQETQHVITEYRWGAFDHFLVEGEYMVVTHLPRSSLTYSIFPRRFFSNDEDWRRFVSLVGQKIQSG